MNRRKIRRVTLWMVSGLVLLGCASPVLVTPPPSVSVPGSLETTIAQTVDAAQTQTAVNAPPFHTPTFTPSPTKTATVTPTPTATVLFLLETNIAGDLLLEEGGVESDEAGAGSLSIDSDSDSDRPFPRPIPEWACQITYRVPANHSVIARDTIFQTVWTLKNVGSKTWPKNGVDVVWASGADLRTGRAYMDIPATVAPGGKVTVVIPLIAPRQPGEYRTRWTLKVGKTEFCGMRIIFTTE